MPTSRQDLLQQIKQWTVPQTLVTTSEAAHIQSRKRLLGGEFDLTNHPQSPVYTLSTDPTAVLVKITFNY